MREHRIRSIPPRTSLDVLRERRPIGSGMIPLGKLVSTDGLSSGRSWHDRPEPNHGGFNVQDHVFRKPTGEKSNEPFTILEGGKIKWKKEVCEDYGVEKGLKVILEFSGIELPNDPVFERSRRDYGQDSRVFYSPVEYKNGRAFLILATNGDIFEAEVVATNRGLNPFFREETHLPLLTITYDPRSMAVNGNNNLVIVGYNRLLSVV